MLSTSQRRADLIAALAIMRQRLMELDHMPAQTISERISRTDARCQAGQEIRRLETLLSRLRDTARRGSDGPEMR